MIYDCFVFYDELDLLEIRLNSLKDVVDRFVLVESKETFLGKEKELFYEKNKERFASFNSRIIHVVVEDFPKFNWKKLRKFRNWDREDYQRNSVTRGLSGCTDQDVIILSDVDEIPNPEKVLEYKNTPGIKTFYQQLYYYYLNNLVIDHSEPNEIYEGYKPWHGPVMASYTYFKSFQSPTKLRTYRSRKDSEHTMVMDGGWHYSFIGGTEMILKKMKSYCHTEYIKEGMLNESWIEEKVSAGEDVFDRPVRFKKLEPGDGASVWLQKNLDRYRHLFL